MSNAFINFFKEPSAKELIKDEKKVDQMYKRYRWQIFYSSYIAYVMFHVCRKNIAVALPAMAKALSFSNTNLGLLGSSLYITYGIGKFVNGILADKSNVRTFLPTALIASAICNICFALSAFFITPGQISFFGLPSSTILLWFFCFFWGANGWFQSMGFPPVAKSLSYWFSNSERATKWAIWSTSHQVGVFAAVMISGFVIDKFGWHAAFWIPGILCVITGFWLFDRLRDKPQTLGLPEVEKYKNEPVAKNNSEDEEANLSYFEIFKKHIICNPVIWMLAIAYVFVYIVRFGTEDWLVKYLVEVKGNSLPLATSKLSSLAIVGAFGTILAGVLSDKVFKGNRTLVNILFLVGLMISLVGLAIVKGGILDFICVALVGMFTAGPQMLIGGICAVESSSKKVASASIGFTGLFGYIGATLSAVGTGYMVDNLGWQGAIVFWGTSAFICLIICLILSFYEKKQKN